MIRRIASDSDLEEGMAALSAAHPQWRALIALTGLPPLRRREAGFAELVAIMVGQQLSVESARAILARMHALLGPLTPERIRLATDDELRLTGLMRPKQRAIRALAEAIVTGALNLDALEHASPEEVHTRLTAIHGIGPWTADIYLLFSLGHGDGFAAGDLAIQEAARHAFGLPARPDAKALAALAENWRPWRGTAARLLWAYYALIKNRQGINA